MRPYLLEGLDCSGKKTVARRVQRGLRERGIDVDLVIGPLCGGPLRALDDRLAGITRPVTRGSAVDRLRRSVYIIGPSIDRLHRTTARTVKISSHYRVWARAVVEDDRPMVRTFAATAALHVRYAGATLLDTEFAVRLQRHTDDVRAGRTSKLIEQRFFGPDPVRFAQWHTVLSGLLTHHIGAIQHLDTTHADPERTAEEVIEHALASWAGH